MATGATVIPDSVINRNIGGWILLMLQALVAVQVIDRTGSLSP